jgi:hypothetical protein
MIVEPCINTSGIPTSCCTRRFGRNTREPKLSLRSSTRYPRILRNRA